MILYGASGHGKVVRSVLIKEVVHFFDDDDSLDSYQGIPVSLYDSEIFNEQDVILTIGNNKIRKKISKKIKHGFGKTIANSSIIDESVRVGFGSQILHNSVVQVDTIIGNHVIINTSSSVDHDCVIEDFVHIAPNATLCGNVNIGEGTLVGAGSVIIPGITIGSWCIIGAGAVVTKDIPDHSIAFGNPARVIRKLNA